MSRSYQSSDSPDAHGLYISYNGLMEPLMRSQGIPYFTRLAKSGLSLHILSYEKVPKRNANWRQEASQLEEELRGEGIRWTSLRYHKRPRLPSSIYDIAQGIIVGAFLMARKRTRVVHARSYLPAVVALFLKKLFKAKFIFDMRGLLPDEYVDGGLLKPNGVIYKIGKYFEKRLLLKADAIVVLTERVKIEIENLPYLKSKGRTPIYVVPCCADTVKFKPVERKGSGTISRPDAERFNLVYAGSVGTWYMTEEMFRFFVELRRTVGMAHFLVLTQGDPKLVESLASRNGLSGADFTVMKSAHDDVPRHIAGSTAGIAFYRQSYSKIATSPIKVGEYLACGIPAVVNSGLGDCDTLIGNNGVGVVLEKFDQAAYQKSARDLVELCKETEALQGRCRALAEKRLSLDGGVQKYLDIYSRLRGGAPPSRAQGPK